MILYLIFFHLKYPVIDSNYKPSNPKWDIVIKKSHSKNRELQNWNFVDDLSSVESSQDDSEEDSQEESETEESSEEKELINYIPPLEPEENLNINIKKKISGNLLFWQMNHVYEHARKYDFYFEICCSFVVY